MNPPGINIIISTIESPYMIGLQYSMACIASGIKVMAVLPIKPPQRLPTPPTTKKVNTSAENRTLKISGLIYVL